MATHADADEWTMKQQCLPEKIALDLPAEVIRRNPPVSELQYLCRL
jgi:hypothetical protein